MRLVLSVVIASVSLSTLVVAQASPRPPVPVDAIPAIVDAFRSHDVVAMSDGRVHGDAAFHTFLLKVLRDPRITATMNDVVLECCNARYQEIADRFTSGEQVEQKQLVLTWRNSTQVNAGQRDGESVIEVLRAIRDANASRPPNRRIRVLLADPPIDWNAVHSAADHRTWIETRDTFPADLIAREVVGRGRKALVIYGGMHLQRKNIAANYESAGLAATLISTLEQATGTRAFTVWFPHDLAALEPAAATWPAASLVTVGGTRLGTIDFARFVTNALPRIRMRDGKPDFAAGPIPRDQWRSLPMEQQFDAVMHLGPPSTLTVAPLDPDVCGDTDFMPILRARMTIVGLTPEIQRLDRLCGPGR